MTASSFYEGRPDPRRDVYDAAYAAQVAVNPPSFWRPIANGAHDEIAEDVRIRSSLTRSDKRKGPGRLALAAHDWRLVETTIAWARKMVG